MSKPTRIRILIADDHPVFRHGLKALIETEADMEVIGEAASGSDAVAMAARFKPDVILMDVTMPDVNGIEASGEIARDHPEIGILILTMLDDETVFAALEAGAKGYLLKGAEGDVTLQAIRAVASGQSIFSPEVSNRVIRGFQKKGRDKSELPFGDLTPREREILDLIARGLTNTAIAEHLVISQKTVRNQVSTIYHKLGVTSRGEAVARARDAGLGE